MRTFRLLVWSVFLSLSVSAFAKGGGNILRGGVGFLFPDHNSFVNASQFSQSRGMAVEALYTRTNQGAGMQAMTPSFVYGNGSFGVGFYGTRVGTELSAGTDVIGTGVGFSLLKGRMSIGAGYDRPLGAGMGDGDFSATLTFNPANRRGAALGIGYRQAITGGNQTLVAGLGFSNSSNNNFEVNVAFPSLSTFSDFDLSVLCTTSQKFLYFGGGYLLQKYATTAHGVVARLGFVMSSSLDLSLSGRHYFGAGNPVTYGASLRASF